MIYLLGMRLSPVCSLCLVAVACELSVEGAAVRAADAVETPSSASSATLKANISASLPKFTAPPAKGASAVPPQSEPSAPRNGIIRLPSYVVRDKKLPEFKPRELLTPAGRLDLALKRHPGLKFGPFASLNKGPALQMLAEEEAIERRAELSDLSGSIQLFDALRAEEEAAARAAPPLK
jgi:hypothetical protein